MAGGAYATIYAMDDAIARYRAASEANDIDALMETLAPDPELVSPLSGRMVFRGRDDVRALLTAVYGSLRDWRWREELGDDARRLVIGEGRVGPFKLTDAMVYDLDEQGRITRVRPHLRPWLGLTGFALLVGPRLARHPGVVWRALRAGG
jgi:SnoaL-like domain